MREKKEILKTKTGQGFKKLLITPFGLPLSELIEKHKNQILRHHQEGTLKATNGDTLDLNESEPIKEWEIHSGADVSGDLVYYPKDYNQTNHGGKTKAELLRENPTGWEIKFIEDLPDLPAKGKGEMKEGRKQLEANKTPKEYLKSIQNDSQYKNEQGLTPEDRLIYAISQLEEKNQMIDDWQGRGKGCWCFGAYFKSSGNVPYGCWLRGGSQAYLSAYDPDDVGSDRGARSGVSF